MEEILDKLKPGGVNVSRVAPLATNWITLDSNFFIIYHFQFKLVLSEDGSGKGAAAIAAAAAEATINLPN